MTRRDNSRAGITRAHPLLIHVKGTLIARQVCASKPHVYAVDSGVGQNHARRPDQTGMAVGNAARRVIF